MVLHVGALRPRDQLAGESSRRGEAALVGGLVAEGFGFDGGEVVALLVLVELVFVGFFFVDDLAAENDVVVVGMRWRRRGVGGGEFEEGVGAGRGGEGIV